MPRSEFKEVIMENLGFKVIALLITLVLWLTILGRREVIYTRTFILDIVLPNQMMLVGQSSENVELKISGSRNLIRRYVESLDSDQLKLIVGQAHEGLMDLEINPKNFDLPSQIRVQSIKPSHVRIEVMSSENFKKLNKKNN